MLVLGVDLETQGLDREHTRITEIGGALWDVFLDFNFWGKRYDFSQLCWESDYPSQPAKIVELTNITDQMLISQGRPRREVIEDKLIPMMEQADLIIAHRKDFDKGVLDFTCKDLGISLPQKPWLCTLTEIKWPAKYTCKKLSHLAYEHSILVDPATLHRAADDIDLMFKLVQKYNFQKLLDYYHQPWVYLRASCAKPWEDNGIQVGIAKSLGFGWEQVPGVDNLKWPKVWVARAKRIEVDTLLAAVQASASPFRVDIIEGIN